MKKMTPLVLIFVILISVFQVSPVAAVTDNNFYLVPAVQSPFGVRYAKYFCYIGVPQPCISVSHGQADYGSLNIFLVAVDGISQADHDALVGHSDVYAFPDNIDTAITDPNIDAFFESWNIPTDWLTPSSTYRDLMRSTMGMFQFNQRFTADCGHSLFDETVTLDTKWNSLSTADKNCFNSVSASYGLPSIQGNPSLRTVVKRADDALQGQTYYLAGIGF